MESFQPNKTFICSVVFLDIVGYSKESVREQLAWKECFNQLITEAIQSVPENERVILDTGDGAALCFLNDPEAAFTAAVTMRKAIIAKSADPSFALKVRTGINLGPVKVVKDINGHNNIIGDGINVAQRVMSFAGAKQIFVSRSYYEVISCLSTEYSRVFHYHGLFKDKHVREHELYEVRFQDGSDEPVAAPEPLTKDQEKPPAIDWDPAVLASLESLFTIYVGPLAKILVKKASKMMPSYHDLCSFLGDQIPDEKTRNVFKSKALALMPNASKGVLWDADVLRTIEQTLTGFMGPVAKILVKKATQNSKSLEELELSLAENIPDKKQRDKFLQLCKKN